MITLHAAIRMTASIQRSVRPHQRAPKRHLLFKFPEFFFFMICSVHMHYNDMTFTKQSGVKWLAQT